MLLLGAGLGLLASQLGNINMSSVAEDKSSQVGGLQGAFQNLGSSFGTALIGSVMIASLTTGFISNVQSSSLPSNIKEYVQLNTKSVQILPSSDVEQYAIDTGLSQTESQQIATIYQQAQLQGLKKALFYLVVITLLSILLSRNLPNK